MPETQSAEDSGVDKNKTDDPEVEEDEIELTTNPYILAVFNIFVFRPYLTLGLIILSTIGSFVVSLPLQRLKNQPLEAHPIHGRLQEVESNILHDFAVYAQPKRYEILAVWGADSLHNQLEALEVVGSIMQSLEVIKASGMCKSLEWPRNISSSPITGAKPVTAPASMVPNHTAVLLPINWRDRLTAWQKSPCDQEMDRMVARAQTTTQLNVAMGSPGAVVRASLDQSIVQTQKHLCLATPIALTLLLLLVGNLQRAITPFLCLAASFLAEQANMVILKMWFPNLNISGPQAMAVFIQLALALDYGLFFWTRFAQERRKNQGPNGYSTSLLRTLMTSGMIILLSAFVMVICFVAMTFYPDQNVTGDLGMWIQIFIGVTFLGVYSLALPTALAALLPSIYDEPLNGSCMDCARFRSWLCIQHDLPKQIFRWIGRIATHRVFGFLLPLITYACFVPLIIELAKAETNPDTNMIFSSPSVPEYEAMTLIKKVPEVQNLANQVEVLLEAVPRGPVQPAFLRGRPGRASKWQQEDLWLDGIEKSDITLSAEFGDMVCRFVRRLIKTTNGTAFQIFGTSVKGIWWNATTGTCNSELPALTVSQEMLISMDGTQQLLYIWPSVPMLSDEAKSMSKFLWSNVEPQAQDSFDSRGQRYDFKARHRSISANALIMDENLGARAPWIIGALVLCMCTFIGISFSSVGVGLKLVATVVVPILAEYGLAVGAFQHGWFRWAGLEPNGGLILWIFYAPSAFLLALAVDYDLFLFMRVYEYRTRGYDNTSAVRIAVEETGPIITVAGTLMCVSFLFFLFADLILIRQLGFLYLVGVAVDTYIVRIWIAPGALAFSESLNYWPGRLPLVTKSYEDFISSHK